MRGLLVIVVIVAGCSDDGKGGGICHYQDHDYTIGETWPAGDNCNDCTCTASGFTCTARPCQAPPDADPATLCQARGTCMKGPPCGAVCCGAGERCAGGVCMCGTQAACTGGNTCEAAGPIGGDACGSICCGATGPCPQ